MADLSEAAEDYGRAFCVSGTQTGMPLAQLPPDIQTCVQRVGQTFQTDVDQKMGLTGAVATDPPLIQRFQVTGPQGATVGSLTFAEGSVTFCRQASPAARHCQLVGYGLDGVHAAHDLLEALGFQVQPVP